jgi:tetratricopeptide (TPR) repeat protein
VADSEGQVDPLVKRLIDAAQKARELGDQASGIQLSAEAAERLFDVGRFQDAIEQYVLARNFAAAAKVAERAGDPDRAAELYAMAKSAEEKRDRRTPRDPVRETFRDTPRDLALPPRASRPTPPHVARPTWEDKTPADRGARDTRPDLEVLSDEPEREGDGRILGGSAGMQKYALWEEATPGNSAVSEQDLRRIRSDPALRQIRTPPLGRDVWSGDERNFEEAQRAERQGDLGRAADIYERAGDAIQAARVLVQEASNDRARSPKQRDLIVRAAALYSSVGKVDRAAAVLEKFGFREDARELRRRAGIEEDSDDPIVPPKPEEIIPIDAPVEQPRRPRPPRARSDSSPASRPTPPAGSPRNEREPIERGKQLLERARNGERQLFTAAIEALSAVDKSHPEYVSARTMLASALAAVGRGVEGLRVLQQILRGVDYAVEHLPALYEYGKLLQLEGHLAEARSTFRMISDLHPTYLDVSRRMMECGTTGVFELKELKGLVKKDEEDEDRTFPSASTAPTQETEAPRRKTPSTPRPQPTPVQRPRVNTPNPVTMLDRAESQAASSGAVPSSTEPEALIGVVLRGRFRFDRLLGAGSQAKVYLASDVVLDRMVAIKVLDLTSSPSETVLSRFLAEARLGAKVHHPCALGVYDFGREGDMLFIALEYLEGQTLRDIVCERGSLAPKTAIRVARDVAAALTAVHKAGIIHRDVKPSNVMVDVEWSVRLADFGVATTIDDAETPAGTIAGTLRYMAPEQGIGPYADPKSDIFSLGVVLFEMLAGNAPYEATVQSLINRAEKPPPDLPRDVRVQESVRKLLAHCLGARLEQRPSARELHEMLDRELAALDRAHVY